MLTGISSAYVYTQKQDGRSPVAGVVIARYAKNVVLQSSGPGWTVQLTALGLSVSTINKVHIFIRLMWVWPLWVLLACQKYISSSAFMLCGTSLEFL